MKDLLIWQKARELVKLVYETTNTFPEEEKFGLISQMRRAAISVASNISEGRGRETPNSKKEFLQFLRMAKGSLFELETQTILCQDLGYIKEPDLFDKITELQKMLTVFMRKKRNS